MEESAMVLESARERLKNISSVASSLNEASDRFTQELRTIEGELNALNVGLECTLEKPIAVSDQFTKYNDDGEPIGAFRTAHYLGYGKDDRGSWKLLVKEYEETLDTSFGNCYRAMNWMLEDTSPLLEASRDLRMAAAGHILSLLELLQNKAEEKIAKLNKVMDTRRL